MSGLVAGTLFGLLSGQPLTILGLTGPDLVFESLVSSNRQTAWPNISHFICTFTAPFLKTDRLLLYMFHLSAFNLVAAIQCVLSFLAFLARNTLLRFCVLPCVCYRCQTSVCPWAGSISPSGKTKPVWPPSPLRHQNNLTSYLCLVQASRVFMGYGIFSRPGRSQGPLYKHLCNSFIHSAMVFENIFTTPPRPNGWRWCFQS